MWCPLEDLELGLERCPAKCMYNRDGQCIHSVVKEAQERASEITDTRAQQAIMSKIVDLPEAERAARRIKAFIYTDSYVQFTLGKTLVELNSKDVDNLMEDEERYTRWPRSRANFFPVIQQVLTLIQNQKGNI